MQKRDWRIWGLGLFLLGALAGDVPRSSAAPPAAATSVTLPDQIDLAALILLTADALDLTLEFDPALVKPSGGTTPAIHFRGERELTKEELWQFTTQVLATRGLAMVRPPGSKVISLVRSDAAAAMAGVRPEGASGVDGRTGFVSELVRLRNRSGKDIQDLAAKLGLKPPAAVTPVGDLGLILVSDYSTRIDDLKRLVERFDVAREPVRIAPVPARHLPAASLASAVLAIASRRESIEGTRLKGELSVAPDGRSLLLIAPEAAHPQWLELIELLDQQETVTTVEYTTRAFDPKEVSDLIEKTVRETVAAAPGPGNGTPIAADRLKLVVNDLTGTLIVTATPSQHHRIRGLIDQLESTSTGSSRPLRAFPIRNRPAKDVMATLAALVQNGALQASEASEAERQGETSGELLPGNSQRTAGSEPASQRSPSSGSITPVVVLPSRESGVSAPLVLSRGRTSDVHGRNSGPGSGRGGGLVAPGLSLNMDEGTNSIIAIAEPRMLAQIEKLIRLIDVRQPQVMLEMTLVSLSEQDAMNLGIELEKVGIFDGASYQFSSLFGLSSGKAGGRTVGDSRGLTSAVLNPGDFSVVLRALQTISKGSTRSVPQVLVSNNETASFNSVLQQPYVVSNTTSGAGTTTSFGGTQDAGTTISVTPQIAQADQLLLQYSITLSSFVGAPPSNGLPPPRQQNTVDSKATIPDGFTVVVGGIELQSEGKNTSQVPGVGDVPLLGELFKTRDNSVGRSRFYVFIRATVLRDQQLNDLKHLSGKSMREALVNDGFPRVTPRVIR